MLQCCCWGVPLRGGVFVSRHGRDAPPGLRCGSVRVAAGHRGLCSSKGAFSALPAALFPTSICSSLIQLAFNLNFALPIAPPNPPHRPPPSPFFPPNIPMPNLNSSSQPPSLFPHTPHSFILPCVELAHIRVRSKLRTASTQASSYSRTYQVLAHKPISLTHAGYLISLLVRLCRRAIRTRGTWPFATSGAPDPPPEAPDPTARAQLGCPDCLCWLSGP